MPSYHYQGVRAFLVLSIISLALSVAAQQPEKVIGAPVDTSAFNGKDTVNISDAAVVLPEAKPIATIPDTIGPRKHSPKTATLLSMALPGAGQVYNGKNWWWKVPIIYAGGAALVYGATFYQKNYVAYRDAYAFTVQNPDVPTGDPRFDQYQDPATLITIRNSYKEARDQCLIGLGLLYALQVLDAAVEAHFLEFNVSEDLSLNIQPQFGITASSAYSGVQLTLRLK